MEKPPPATLYGITDEAFDLVDARIDELRMYPPNDRNPPITEMSFLKDLRNLLRLAENFRDE